MLDTLLNVRPLKVSIRSEIVQALQMTYAEPELTTARKTLI